FGKNAMFGHVADMPHLAASIPVLHCTIATGPVAIKQAFNRVCYAPSDMYSATCKHVFARKIPLYNQC
ncbi:MAG: hypothetical protein WA908_10690, partial [Pontixanthobacter sp.]